MPVYLDNQRGGYYYSFTRDGRRYRSKRYPRKKEAEDAMAAAMLSVGVVPSETLTFSQAAEAFLREKKDRLKVQSYDRVRVMLGHFLATLGDVPVDRLTVDQYTRALQYLDNYEHLGRRLKNSYKNKVIRTFKNLCQWCARRYDLVTTVPDKFDAYRNEEKEEMQIITLDQFRALLDVCNEEPWRALFITLFYMGLRIGEANALTFADLDFNAGTLSVNKTVSTKITSENGHYLITSPKTRSSVRTLPMPHVVSAALLHLRELQYGAEEKPAQAFVFGGLGPVPETTLQKKKKFYLEKAGLPIIRLHDFRHSCASFLINNGATPLLVSRWLGHANVTMTLNTYSHLWADELDKIVAVIDKNQ